MSRDSQPSDLNRWRADLLPEIEVIAHHLNLHEHLFYIAGDGNLFHRIGELSILYPDPHSAAGVISGYRVKSKADQFCDIKACVHRLYNVRRGVISRG